MLVKVTVIAPFSEFVAKSGKTSYRAPCTFSDDGARFPVGRGTLYATQPQQVGKDGLAIVARLVSYDRGEARFAV